MNDEQVTKLLYQALETEQGGTKVHQTPCGAPGERRSQGGMGLFTVEGVAVVGAWAGRHAILGGRGCRVDG